MATTTAIITITAMIIITATMSLASAKIFHACDDGSFSGMLEMRDSGCTLYT